MSDGSASRPPNLRLRMPAVDSFPEIEVTFDPSDVTPSMWALVSAGQGESPRPRASHTKPKRPTDTPLVTPIPTFFEQQEGDSLVNRALEMREERRSVLGSWLVVGLVIVLVWAAVGVAYLFCR